MGSLGSNSNVAHYRLSLIFTVLMWNRLHPYSIWANFHNFNCLGATIDDYAAAVCTAIAVVDWSVVFTHCQTITSSLMGMLL